LIKLYFKATAEEFIDVVKKLWDSWEDESLIIDKKLAQFSDPSKIHSIHHKGKWFSVEGPLNPKKQSNML
jgi:N-acetyl-S-(2-succino)cysteine monooxygenase